MLLNTTQNPPEQTVHIIDDDEALRDSLIWLLETEGHTVATYPSAEDFLLAWSPEMRGCALLDVRMPGMSGLELFEKLLTLHNTLPIIFITGHGDVPMAVTALKKGAIDFIEKPFNDRDMLKLIEQCLSIDREKHSQWRQNAETARRREQLTGREREVLELIVAGRLNKQIADDLGISIKTVEVHRARVMEKMGVASLAELVQLVMAAEVRR